MFRNSQLSKVNSNLMGTYLQVLQKYITKNSLIVLLLEFHILIISLMYSEITYKKMLVGYEDYLLYFILILTLMLVIQIFVGNHVEKKINRSLEVIYKEVKMQKQKNRILFFKLLSTLIIPNPLLEIPGYNTITITTDIFDLSFTYKINDIMTALMVF